MKKTVGICFFAAALVTVAVGYCVMFQNKTEQKEKQGSVPQQIQSETEEMAAIEITESMAPPGTYEYVVLVKDNRLAVYRKGEKEIYFETNIRVDELDKMAAQKAESGIYFQNEQELYAFLESYSS